MTTPPVLLDIKDAQPRPRYLLMMVADTWASRAYLESLEANVRVWR